MWADVNMYTPELLGPDGRKLSGPPRISQAEADAQRSAARAQKEDSQSPHQTATEPTEIPLRVRSPAEQRERMRRVHSWAVERQTWKGRRPSYGRGSRIDSHQWLRSVLKCSFALSNSRELRTCGDAAAANWAPCLAGLRAVSGAAKHPAGA
jgi:hypothetical protein